MSKKTVLDRLTEDFLEQEFKPAMEGTNEYLRDIAEWAFMVGFNKATEILAPNVVAPAIKRSKGKKGKK